MTFDFQGRMFLGPDSETALSLAAVLGDVYLTHSLATEVSTMYVLSPL